MSPDDSIHGLMLIYVAGAADEDEISRAETLLCGGTPRVMAAFAEATAVYHAMPMALLHVAPPARCCDNLFGRITSDLSADTAATDPLRDTLARAAATPLGVGRMRPADAASGAAPSSTVTRLRWPIYITSGLAACLAVALTMAMANRNSLEHQYTQAASTLETSKQILRSPQVSMASLETNGPPDAGWTNSFGRGMFCRRSGQCQFTFFDMPLPVSGREYELWFILPDGKEIPAGVFEPDADGSVTVASGPNGDVTGAAWVAISDEPAGGSSSRTGPVHLKGTLRPAQ